MEEEFPEGKFSNNIGALEGWVSRPVKLACAGLQGIKGRRRMGIEVDRQDWCVRVFS